MVEPPAGRKGERVNEVSGAPRFDTRPRGNEAGSTESKVPHLVTLLDRISDLDDLMDRADHHCTDADGEDDSEGGRVDPDNLSDVLAVDVCEKVKKGQTASKGEDGS